MPHTRKFDHDAARRLHAEGLSYAEIGRRFGVSVTAVLSVCNPARQRRRSREWQREHMRAPCKGGCGALVWTVTPGRTGFCPKCIGKKRTEADERRGELRCNKCGEWKPDEEFREVSGRESRRGRAGQCRSCESATRRAHRARTATT